MLDDVEMDAMGAVLWLVVLVNLCFAEDGGIIPVARLVSQQIKDSGPRIRRKLPDDFRFQSVFRDDETNNADLHAQGSKFRDIVTSRDISTLLKQLRKAGTDVKRGSSKDEFGEYDYVDYKIPKGVELDYDGFFGDDFDFTKEDKSSYHTSKEDRSSYDVITTKSNRLTSSEEDGSIHAKSLIGKLKKSNHGLHPIFSSSKIRHSGSSEANPLFRDDFYTSDENHRDVPLHLSLEEPQLTYQEPEEIIIEQDYVQPQSYEETIDIYLPPEQSYEAPEQSYEAPEQNYEAPEQNHKEPDIKNELPLFLAKHKTRVLQSPTFFLDDNDPLGDNFAKGTVGEDVEPAKVITLNDLEDLEELIGDIEQFKNRVTFAEGTPETGADKETQIDVKRPLVLQYIYYPAAAIGLYVSPGDGSTVTSHSLNVKQLVTPALKSNTQQQQPTGEHIIPDEGIDIGVDTDQNLRIPSSAIQGLDSLKVLGKLGLQGLGSQGSDERYSRNIDPRGASTTDNQVGRGAAGRLDASASKKLWERLQEALSLSELSDADDVFSALDLTDALDDTGIIHTALQPRSGAF